MKRAVSEAEKRLMDKIDIEINKNGYAYVYGKKIYSERLVENDYMYFWAERGTDNIKRSYSRRYTDVEDLMEDEGWEEDGD